MIQTTDPSEAPAEVREYVQKIPTEQFVASPWNRMIHEHELTEIRASIKQHGQKTPALARLLPDGRKELVAGHRRWLSCIAEGIPVLDSIVRVMTDREACETVLIENLESKKLTPLEEARGYQHLLDMRDPVTGDAIYTAETIAKRINRDPNHIYRALKWARLPDVARQAFEKDCIGKELATIISRIPGEAERQRFALETVFSSPEDFYQVLEEDAVPGMLKLAKKMLEKPDTITPMPVLLARAHCEEHYMQSLKETGIPLMDPLLVPEKKDASGGRICGGSCLDCEHRTGGNPAYASEISKAGSGEGRSSGLDPMTCTMPSCLRMKLAAHWTQTVAALQKQTSGTVVILKEEEAKKYFDGKGRLLSGAGMVDAEEKPGFELVGHVDEEKTPVWGKLVDGLTVKVEGQTESKKLEVPVQLALDPKGRTRRLYERVVAVAAVNLAKGKQSPFTRATKAEDRPKAATASVTQEGWKSGQQREEQRQETQQVQESEAEIKKQARNRSILAVDLLWQHVLSQGLSGKGQIMLIELALEEAGMDGVKLVAEWLKLKVSAPEGTILCHAHYQAAIMEKVQTWDSQEASQAFLLVAIIAQRVAWNGMDAPVLKKAMRFCSVKPPAETVVVGSKKGKVKSEKVLKPEMKSRSAAAVRNEESVDADERSKVSGQGSTEGETWIDAVDRAHVDVVVGSKEEAQKLAAERISPVYTPPTVETGEDAIIDKALHHTANQYNLRSVLKGKPASEFLRYAGSSEPVMWQGVMWQGAPKGLSYRNRDGVEVIIPWNRVVARAKAYTLTPAKEDILDIAKRLPGNRNKLEEILRKPVTTTRSTGSGSATRAPAPKKGKRGTVTKTKAVIRERMAAAQRARWKKAQQIAAKGKKKGGK